MNHDILDSASYAWRTTCLNKPAYEVKHDDTEILGKVTAVDYTSDKDHCIYITCNPEGSKWIDFIKKRIDMGERQQRLAYNSYYGMYAEERPKFDLKQYLQSKYLKNGEDKKMTQAEITYEAQKHELEQEEAAEFNQLLADQAAARHNLKTKYDQKRFDLEKLKEDAENKEKADAHAKAIKDTYDAYIAQGFTKTQAESFLKNVLENLKT